MPGKTKFASMIDVRRHGRRDRRVVRSRMQLALDSSRPGGCSAEAEQPLTGREELIVYRLALAIR